MSRATRTLPQGRTRPEFHLEFTFGLKLEFELELDSERPRDGVHPGLEPGQAPTPVPTILLGARVAAGDAIVYRFSSRESSRGGAGASEPPTTMTRQARMGDRLHIRLYGTVQGVGFRYFAAQTAARTGIIGYARNLPDGSVEVEAEGDTRALAQFRDALVQGPPYARVQRVETLPPGPEALGTRFEIRR